MIDVVYYNDKMRCYRNGVVERWYYGKYWRIVENTDNHSAGYNIIKTNNEKIRRHRLIAFCFLGLENIVGGDDTNDIDHINGNKIDNCVDNLRIVSHQQNHFNHTKAKGCYWRKNKNKWQAQIGVNGKKIHLGYFLTETEAHQAYLSAKLIHHRI